MGKPEGKRPLRGPGCKLKDNIRVNFRNIGCVVWTGLIWLRIETSTVLLSKHQ
jgi:hypothetical protein